MAMRQKQLESLGMVVSNAQLSLFGVILNKMVCDFTWKALVIFQFERFLISLFQKFAFWHFTACIVIKVTSTGHIKAKLTAATKEMEQLQDDKDQRLVCCICREGYKFYPNKVLGIYTFTSRCVLEDFENKPRRSQVMIYGLVFFNFLKDEIIF